MAEEATKAAVLAWAVRAAQPSSSMLLGCTQEDLLSSKQTVTEGTSSKDDSVIKPRQPEQAESSKWSSFILSLATTGEFTSAGSGLRLIPVVLPPGVAEHALCNSNLVSLSAVSYTHLTLPTIYSV